MSGLPFSVFKQRANGMPNSMPTPTEGRLEGLSNWMDDCSRHSFRARPARRDFKSCSCVRNMHIGKYLDLTEPQFPHPKNGTYLGSIVGGHHLSFDTLEAVLTYKTSLT